MSDQSLGSPAGMQASNGKATWSLVLGILSVTFCGLFAAIAAIILGKQAQQEIAASGGLQGGEGRARAGVVLGWVSVAISVLALVIALIAFLGS